MGHGACLALPLAHVGHWLWVFYVLPVLIVIGGIVSLDPIAGEAARSRERGSDARRGG